MIEYILAVAVRLSAARLSKTRSLAKDGSKITSYRNEMVTFRVTGKIDYEFSTTSGNSMILQGPVVKDEYIGD